MWRQRKMMGGILMAAVFCAVLILGSSSETLALGEAMSPVDSLGFTMPAAHGSTRNIHAYIRGFNFSDLPDSCLYSPAFAVSENSRDLFGREGHAFSGESAGSKRDVLDQVRGDSGSILAMAVGVVAFLYVMPESFSKWGDEDKNLEPKGLWRRYDNNVSGGPVWDKDEWEVNYIGHPYFGAAYYTHAMGKDYTRLESLTYSFMMSACLYEYGLEAFFEDPSIQDIIVTPLGGALFGEVFILMKDGIKSNGNKVLGSKILGSVCMFMLDPVTATLEPINRFNEKYSKLRMESRYYSRSTVTSESISSPGTIYDHRIGVEISIYTHAFSR